jgi:hypothetical protein
MKRQNIRTPIIILILAALLVFSTCTDPVFYTISQEVRSRDARIKGSPSNIVEFNGFMYVASNALFRYKSGYWAVADSPPGKKINQIAATGTFLYALCSSGSGSGNFTLHRTDGGGWAEVNIGALSGYQLFSIYADDKQLFAGAWNRQDSSSTANYALFWANKGTNALVHLRSGTGILSGAAYDDGTPGNEHHFLSTGNGIYVTNDPPTTITPVIGGIFSGIIRLKSETVAVDRAGGLYTVTDSGGVLQGRVGYRATGALATYKSGPSATEPELLLVGIQGSSGSSNYGYREFLLGTGDLSDMNSRPPGYISLTSIPGCTTSRYETTLGHRAVNYLHQATDSVDGNMTLFASTVKDGLFSFRDRKGGPQWNAEE